MKRTRQTRIRRVAIGIGLMVGFLAFEAIGNNVPSVPQYVGVAEPLLDPVGRLLPGQARDEGSSRNLVELRRINPGQRHLGPQADAGSLATRNPLIQESYVGANMPGETSSGKFCIALQERLPVAVNGTEVQYYVRVYSYDKYYYMDSADFRPTNSASQTTINLTFPSGFASVDTNSVWDTDGDGIPDGMEVSLGLDPTSDEARADGWDHLFVLLHEEYMGLSETNWIVMEIAFPGELFEEEGGGMLRKSSGEPAELHTVSWNSIPGVHYRLEYKESLEEDAADNWEKVWPEDPQEGYPADGTRMVIDIEDVIDGVATGFFRVVAMPYHKP